MLYLLLLPPLHSSLCFKYIYATTLIFFFFLLQLFSFILFNQENNNNDEKYVIREMHFTFNKCVVCVGVFLRVSFIQKSLYLIRIFFVVESIKIDVWI